MIERGANDDMRSAAKGAIPYGSIPLQGGGSQQPKLGPQTTR